MILTNVCKNIYLPFFFQILRAHVNKRKKRTASWVLKVQAQDLEPMFVSCLQFFTENQNHAVCITTPTTCCIYYYTYSLYDFQLAMRSFQSYSHFACMLAHCLCSHAYTLCNIRVMHEYPAKCTLPTANLRGTYLEKGYGDVQRERSPFHASATAPQDHLFSIF